MNKKKRIFLQRKMYDHLFYEDKNPYAANLYLLILELEELHLHHGVRPSFGDFSASKEKVAAFLIRNKEALQKLFVRRFQNPTGYHFNTKEENSPFFNLNELN